MLDDVSTPLSKAAASGATGTAALPTTLSPATRQKIAAAIRNATVDIWTGASDRTLRKLAINLDIPVSGTISTLLGGLSSAGVTLTLDYARLNQPQTVTTPAQRKAVLGVHHPAAEHYRLDSGQPRGRSRRRDGLGGHRRLGGDRPPGTSGAAARIQKYSACIQQAGGDVTEMQKCAALLQSG